MAFENQKIDKLSASITELLSAQNVDVDSVILFGSYANGKQTKDSDLDLIVVSPSFRGKDIFEKTDLIFNIIYNLIINYT